MHFDVTRPVFAIPTLCMILLRERRQEIGLRSEVIADRLRLSFADWTKAETAQSPFDFGLFINACDVMNEAPSNVMFIAECYVQLLRARGWDVLVNQPSKGGRDDLLARAQAFWKTQLGMGSWRDYPVLKQPGFEIAACTPIVRYALDEFYCALQDNLPRLILDLSPASTARLDGVSA
jgi:hypothetical protein